MPFGKAPKVVARGNTSRSSAIKEGPGRSNVVAEREQTGVTSEVVFEPGEAQALLEMGHTVSSCINFQTVTSTVRLTMPSKTDEQSLERTKKRIQAWVEKTLAEESVWAKEVLMTLSDAKRSIEG